MKKGMASLRHNNRGAGIVTVLICTMFITILGATLLFTSYTGLQLRAAERSSKVSFYTAETAMNEVRAGVQAIVTDCIGEAYTHVLKNYNEISADNSKTPQSVFQERFVEELRGYKLDNTDLCENGRYNPDLLLAYISDGERSRVSLADGLTDGDDHYTCSVSVDDDSVTFEGFGIVYTGDDGYESRITTDFDIKLPSFSYTLSSYSMSGISRYAVIAKTGLTCNTVGRSLTGSAYAGKIDLTGAGTGLNLAGGTVVSAGTVTMVGASKLSVEDTSSLWAKDIILSDADSGVALSGAAYVADDLQLDGAEASATLSGTYYGFGYVENNLYDAASADASSAIVVNGRDCTLDMDGLSELVLAGSSYIYKGADAAQTAESVALMGQSVAVKSDQRAYLVPESCLDLENGVIYSNPQVLAAGTTAVPDAIMTTIEDKARAASGYVSGVQVVYSPQPSATGTTLAYFFLTFDSKADANDYFAEYFEENQDEITRYLALYTPLASLSTADASLSSGYVYEKTGDVLQIAIAGQTVLKDTAQRLQGRYDNLKVTLSSTVPAPTGDGAATNPYAYFVDVDSLPAATVEFRTDDRAVGLIVNGNIILNGGDYPDVHAIIATGDITVNRDYTGLLIAGGTVTLGGNVTANDTQASASLQGRAEVGGTDKAMIDYLRVRSGTGSASGAVDAGAWDVDNLVSFSNWQKN